MENDAKMTAKKKTIIWIICLSVFVLILAGLLIWQIQNLKKAKQTVDAGASATSTVSVTPTVTKSATKTASVSATVTGSSSATEEEVFSQVDKTVEGYLAAYIQRDLAGAKLYMTDAFFATWTQDAFAGVSSPSRDRYQIVDTTAGADRYQVKAKVYLKLDGEDAGTESWIVDVVTPSQNSYLVSAMNSASF